MAQRRTKACPDRTKHSVDKFDINIRVKPVSWLVHVPCSNSWGGMATKRIGRTNKSRVVRHGRPIHGY